MLLLWRDDMILALSPPLCPFTLISSLRPRCVLFLLVCKQSMSFFGTRLIRHQLVISIGNPGLSTFYLMSMDHILCSSQEN